MATSEATKRRVRALKRLILASTTFKSVELMCDHVESLGEPTSTLLHVPLLAGVCVTYMKPFMSSGGLGTLPASFEDFEEEKTHARFHEDLKRLRNWFYAHRDVKNIPTLLGRSSPEERFDKVIFHLESNRTYSFSVHELSWEIVGLTRVRDLCRFQRQRADTSADQILHQLFANVALVPGSYLIEDDFARLIH